MIIVDSISALLSPVIGSTQHHQGTSAACCYMLSAQQAFYLHNITMLAYCYSGQVLAEGG